jgi:hypothetical protein
MTKLGSLVGSSVALMLVLVAGCSSSSEPPAPEQTGEVKEALPKCSTVADYYSDPAKTHYVGGCTVLCNGHRLCDPGCPTAYVTWVDSESCTPGVIC